MAKTNDPKAASTGDGGKPPERGAQEQSAKLTEQQPALESKLPEQPRQQDGGSVTVVNNHPTSDEAARIHLLEEKNAYIAAQVDELRELLKQSGAAYSELLKQTRSQGQAPQDVPGDDGKVTIVNQRTSPVTIFTTGGAAIVLAPGSNPIPAREWAAAKSHPQVQRMLEVGKDPFSKQGLRDAGTGFTKDMNLTEALLLIHSTTSQEALERTLYGEERPAVRNAGDAQAKRIKDAEERIRSGG